MNIYLKTAGLVAFLYIMIGLVCPFLISSKHNEFVVLGFVLLAALPVAVYYLFRLGSKPKEIPKS